MNRENCVTLKFRDRAVNGRFLGAEHDGISAFSKVFIDQCRLGFQLVGKSLPTQERNLEIEFIGNAADFDFCPLRNLACREK